METKNREKLLLIITGAVVGLLVLNWIIISPLRAGWHNRADRIDGLRKQIADAEVLRGRGSYIRERWGTMSSNALPNAPATAERQLYDAYDRWVRESRVTQVSFKTQTKTTDDNYSVMECHAEVTGSYRTIIRFLFDLESDPMGLQVQGVEMNSRDDTGQLISLGLDLNGLLLPPPNS